MPRIVDLQARRLDVELTEPFGIATGAQTVAANALARVTLDDGTTGLGEAAPFPAVNGETQAQALAAIESARPALVGQEAGDWRRATAEVRTGTNCKSALCAIECAVLDAKLRSEGESLWRHFGASIDTLKTDITIPTGTPGDARRAAARAIGDGFETLKVKVGAADLDEDIARVQAIRNAAPHAALVLDGNAAFDPNGAIALLERAGREGIVLFEQPTPSRELEMLGEVKKRGQVPVAADESAGSVADVHRIAQERCADVVNIKITKSGLAEALGMVEATRRAGLELMIGGMVETKLAMGVSACIAAGLGGFQFIDLDTPMFLRASPIRGGWRQRGPILEIDSTRAGHGVTLEEP